jgi:hypothetical protein
MDGDGEGGLQCRTPHTEHRLSKGALQGLITKPKGQIP